MGTFDEWLIKKGWSRDQSSDCCQACNKAIKSDAWHSPDGHHYHFGCIPVELRRQHETMLASWVSCQPGTNGNLGKLNRWLRQDGVVMWSEQSEEMWPNVSCIHGTIITDVTGCALCDPSIAIFAMRWDQEGSEQ